MEKGFYMEKVAIVLRFYVRKQYRHPTLSMENIMNIEINMLETNNNMAIFK